MSNLADVELSTATDELATIGRHFAGGKFAPYLSVFEGASEFVALIDAVNLLRLRNVGTRAMLDLESHLVANGWKVFYTSHRSW